MAFSKDPKFVSMKVIRMITMPVSDCGIGEIVKEAWLTRHRSWISEYQQFVCPMTEW